MSGDSHGSFAGDVAGGLLGAMLDDEAAETTEINGVAGDKRALHNIRELLYYCKNLIELIRDDFNIIMWISMGFVLLLLFFTYRNIWITLIALMPMVLSWYTVLGAMALFGQTFNLVNIIVSSFVFGIGVDYSVFIMEGLLKGDDNNPTMVYNKTAITMSAVILVICMFVLGFAIHPAVSSISFASLVGMITTIMLSYTLEPVLYRFYLRCKKRLKKENK